MKTMAALLRDPYPIHWDAEGNEKMGIKGKVVNQGPLNLSYIVNMLMNWQGQDCIRRLQVRFTGWVLGGDVLSAHGKGSFARYYLMNFLLHVRFGWSATANAFLKGKLSLL